MKYSILAILLMVLIVPAMATPSDYTSKYSDVSRSEVYATGTLSGSIRCAENTFTNEIGVRNDLTPDAAFEFFPILPDGTFEIELIPGNFTLYLKDGNGGQPEYSHARISAGITSHPERDFVGHAVSEPGTSKPSGRIYVFWATYGMYNYVCDKPVAIADRVMKPQCHYEGGFAVVNTNIQTVVDAGVTSFKFTDSGITSNNGVLLNPIPDPAPGLLKKIYIAYYKNGVINFRNAMEYEIITL